MWPFDDALCGNCLSRSIYIARWGLDIVVPAPGVSTQAEPQGMKGQVSSDLGRDQEIDLAKVFQSINMSLS